MQATWVLLLLMGMLALANAQVNSERVVSHRKASVAPSDYEADLEVRNNIFH